MNVIRAMGWAVTGFFFGSMFLYAFLGIQIWTPAPSYSFRELLVLMLHLLGMAVGPLVQMMPEHE